MKVRQFDKGCYLVTSKKYQNIVEPDWFDHNKLAQQGDIIGQSVGRSVTYFFQKNGKQFVLRNYYRGGLVGKLIEDSYIFNRLKLTRPYREHRLLRKMRKMNLPVPKPVAFLVKRQGLTYRASIIIRLLKNTQDLFHVLQSRPLSQQEWQSVGELIKKFHTRGVYHSDLNIHNILLNKKGKLWLIDFDKGRLIAPNSSKLNVNIERLQRSLRKEKLKHPDFHWREQDWAWFLQGYHARPLEK